MLSEIIHIRQHEGEPKRKWYESEYFDLIVWFSEDDEIIGFQLCYDKKQKERALTWKGAHIYTHDCIDDGENREGALKGSPILKADGIFEKDVIAMRFKKESKHLNNKIADFIYKKILEY